VVDDDDEFRATLVNLLAGDGFTCDQASSGPEALSLLKSTPCAVGIFDIKMPGMDGCELALSARAIDPSMRLIAVSGVDCSPELLDRGFDAALQKPFDICKLLRILNAIEKLSADRDDNEDDDPSAIAPR
jgi:DNA-binding response OmpR family regulator